MNLRDKQNDIEIYHKIGTRITDSIVMFISGISEFSENGPPEEKDLEKEMTHILKLLAGAINNITNCAQFSLKVRFVKNEKYLLFNENDGQEGFPIDSSFKEDTETEILPWLFTPLQDENGHEIGKKVQFIQGQNENISIFFWTSSDKSTCKNWKFFLHGISSLNLFFSPIFILINSRIESYQANKIRQFNQKLTRFNSEIEKAKSNIDMLTYRLWHTIELELKDSIKIIGVLKQLHKGSKDLSESYEVNSKLNNDLYLSIKIKIHGYAIEVYKKILQELLNLGRMIEAVEDTPLHGENGNNTESEQSQNTSDYLNEIYNSIIFFENKAKDNFTTSKELKILEMSFLALLDRKKFQHDLVEPSGKSCLELDFKENYRMTLFSLFPYWVYLEKEYRSYIDLVRPRIPASGEDIWQEITAQTMEKLIIAVEGIILEQGWASDKKKDNQRFESPQFRNLLLLWFSLKNLEHPLQAPSFETVHYRAELAYTIREALRFAFLGDRADYSANEATGIIALKHLVETYVHHQADPITIGLSETYDIRRFLNELGQVWGLTNTNSPIHYLNHVLNVFMAGLFMLDVTITRDGHPTQDGKPRPLADHLVSPNNTTASPDALREFKQAFTLAALFHDVSHLVCPFEEGAGTSLIKENRLLKLSLEGIEKTLQESGSGIARKCIEDLEAGGYFDRRKEYLLAQWLEEQAEKGEPDHGLISAWHLHHLCVGSGIKANGMFHKAVRAILLHNAVTLPLSLEDDPVAAFLVMINELFEWEIKYHFSLAHSEKGNPFPLLAFSDNSRESHYRFFSCRHLSAERVKVEKQGKEQGKESHRLEIKLKLSEDESWEWPHFEVDLQDPELLDVSILSIWLTKAQSFARFKPMKANGWFPKLTLRNSRPPLRLQKGLQTHDLLELLAVNSRLPIRPYLKRWLQICADDDLFSKVPASDQSPRPTESLQLQYQAEPLFYEDIRKWLPRLIQEADSLLQGLRVGNPLK